MPKTDGDTPSPGDDSPRSSRSSSGESGGGSAGFSRRSSLDFRDLGIREETGSRGSEDFPSLDDLPADRLTRFQPEKGGAAWTGQGKKVGHGLEADVFQAGRSVVKTFTRHRDFARSQRDSEFTALRSVHEEAPWLVPEPHDTGTATVGEGSRPALSMEHLEGRSYAGRRLKTPELQALRAPLRQLGRALQKTGASWDNTPANIMDTPGGIKFIDFKKGSGAPPQEPDDFVRSQLQMMAGRNRSSVDKALSRPAIVRPGFDTPARQPQDGGLFPTLPIRKAPPPPKKAASKPSEKVSLPSIQGHRVLPKT